MQLGANLKRKSRGMDCRARMKRKSVSSSVRAPVFPCYAMIGVDNFTRRVLEIFTWLVLEHSCNTYGFPVFLTYLGKKIKDNCPIDNFYCRARLDDIQKFLL